MTQKVEKEVNAAEAKMNTHTLTKSQRLFKVWLVKTGRMTRQRARTITPAEVAFLFNVYAGLVEIYSGGESQ